MIERPILFSAEMVRAILDGRKTQTRRIMNPQPKKGSRYFGWELPKYTHVAFGNSKIESKHKFPYGGVGDVLWVKETTYNENPIGETPAYVYRADHPNWIMNSGGKWKPSIFMPKDAARIWLRITNMRVERLQEISNEDSKAEGLEWFADCFWWKNYLNDPLPGTSCAIESFKSLWQSINGEQSWNDNPWVWVIEFERIEKPIK